MDDTLLFIPPCCVDKKLPSAIIQAPYRCLSFYTHGDVTAEKFYKAVSHLVVGVQAMVLTMNHTGVDTMGFLRQCFEREWISSLVLSTLDDCSKLVKRFLADYADKVLYVQSDDVSELSSHMVVYSSCQALSIEGPMYERAHDVRLVSYSLTFTPSRALTYNSHDWGNSLRNVLFPDVLRHRHAVLQDKREVKDAALRKFLACDFVPRYSDAGGRDVEPAKDHYMFD